MATVRSVSPGGALLRTSRLFSIPAPIHRAAAVLPSDTATAPFPTHQAITTLKSSRKRGDWGLKRSLPLRSTTKSAQGMIRVKHIDSVEQVTDFSSATDHGITLQKFQDLRIPMTVPGAGRETTQMKKMAIPRKSVFEEDSDITANTDNIDIDKRWKFTGPWLAGMSIGEFNTWLDKKVKPRRVEFHEFLKAKIAGQMTATALAEAADSGETPSAIDPASITEDQVTDYIRNLRRSGDYQELYKTVGQFLDLAPLEAPQYSDLNLGPLKRANETSTFTSALDFHQTVAMEASKNPYAERGPPVTHPSAGISYLRTGMYMDNHPVYGPQQHHPPVVARILKPRDKSRGAPVKIGMAGFVVNSPFGDSSLNQNSIAGLATNHLDPTKEGGAKVYLQPHAAHVDAEGRIVPEVTDVYPDEGRLVAMEMVGEEKIFGEEPVEVEPPISASDRIRSNTLYRASRMSSAESYGVNGTSRLRSW